MPELPEVEIVRQSLLKNIKGKKINKVLVRNRNLRLKLETAFEKKLKNKFISNIKRFSKLIGTLNLKFLFLIITFLTILPLIFLLSDCRTISTSGNSGI